MDFACGLFGGFSASELPVPLASTTKLPAWLYGGEEEAAQWLPSGHYNDQLYEVELCSFGAWQAKTMAEVLVLVKKKQLKKAVLWAPHSRKGQRIGPSLS